MAITNDIKSGIKLTADAVTDVTHSVIEKSRLKAKASRIKQVIKSDSQRREQAYMELGKYFYENHRDLVPNKLDETCIVIEKTSFRIDKATKRYFEILTECDNVTLASENTEKIKKIVCDKTEEFRKNTGEKINEVGTKTKAKATELSGKTKEKAKDIAQKAKDKIDDFKAYVKPEEDEIYNDDDFEDFLTPDEDEDLDNFIIVDEDFEDDSINLDDYKTEVAEAVEEIAEEIEADADIAVVTVDDEESPDEFEF